MGRRSRVRAARRRRRGRGGRPSGSRARVRRKEWLRHHWHLSVWNHRYRALLVRGKGGSHPLPPASARAFRCPSSRRLRPRTRRRRPPWVGGSVGRSTAAPWVLRRYSRGDRL